MPTVPKSRIDADVHGELMVLPPNTLQPPTGKGLTLPEPAFPHCPEKLSDPGPGSPPEKRDCTLSQTYRAMRGCLFPYIRSRVLLGEFPTTPGASMSLDHNLLSVVSFFARENRLKQAIPAELTRCPDSGGSSGYGRTSRVSPNSPRLNG